MFRHIFYQLMCKLSLNSECDKPPTHPGEFLNQTLGTYPRPDQDQNKNQIMDDTMIEIIGIPRPLPRLRLRLRPSQDLTKTKKRQKLY